MVILGAPGSGGRASAGVGFTSATPLRTSKDVTAFASAAAAAAAAAASGHAGSRASREAPSNSLACVIVLFIFLLFIIAIILFCIIIVVVVIIIVIMIVINYRHQLVCTFYRLALPFSLIFAYLFFSIFLIYTRLFLSISPHIHTFSFPFALRYASYSFPFFLILMHFFVKVVGGSRLSSALRDSPGGGSAGGSPLHSLGGSPTGTYIG